MLSHVALPSSFLFSVSLLNPTISDGCRFFCLSVSSVFILSSAVLLREAIVTMHPSTANPSTTVIPVAMIQHRPQAALHMHVPPFKHASKLHPILLSSSTAQRVTEHRPAHGQNTTFLCCMQTAVITNISRPLLFVFVFSKCTCRVRPMLASLASLPIYNIAWRLYHTSFHSCLFPPSLAWTPGPMVFHGEEALHACNACKAGDSATLCLGEEGRSCNGDYHRQ